MAKKSSCNAAPKVPRRTAKGAAMIRDMQELIDVVKSGEPIHKHFTVRQLTIKVEAKQYTPDDVKAVRDHFHASQALFAKCLGVTTQTIALWEQGRRKVPLIACRYMDDLQEFPEIWKKRLVSTKVE